MFVYKEHISFLKNTCASSTFSIALSNVFHLITISFLVDDGFWRFGVHCDLMDFGVHVQPTWHVQPYFFLFCIWWTSVLPYELCMLHVIFISGLLLLINVWFSRLKYGLLYGDIWFWKVMECRNMIYVCRLCWFAGSYRPILFLCHCVLSTKHMWAVKIVVTIDISVFGAAFNLLFVWMML